MEDTPREQIFDPESINAFQPPEYAKDPPKYQDIFSGSSGTQNLAFAMDDGINPASSESLPGSAGDDKEEEAPPPPYTLHSETVSPRDGSQTQGNTVEEAEVDIAVSSSTYSSPSRLIRVSSSSTVVDNTSRGQESSVSN